MYTWLLSIAYNLLLFGGASLESVRELQVTLRVFRDLTPLCCRAHYRLIVQLSRTSCSSGYLVRDMHVLDPQGNTKVWSLSSMFLFDRRLLISNHLGVHGGLAYSTVSCLLNFGTVSSLRVNSSLSLRSAERFVVQLRVISNGIYRLRLNLYSITWGLLLDVFVT
jgi:hypothetical protein